MSSIKYMVVNQKNCTSDMVQSAVKMYCEMYNKEPWNGKWTGFTAFERIMRFLEAYYGLCIFALDEKNNALGFVLGVVEQWWDGRYYCIKDFCVHPEHQGQLIGSQIMLKLIESMREMHVKSMSVHTRCTADSIRFYEKFGFHKMETMGFYNAAIVE